LTKIKAVPQSHVNYFPGFRIGERMSPLLQIARIGLVVAFMATSTAYAQTAGPRDSDVKAGLAIAKTDCAACHAIGLNDKSPHPDAPAFRDLGRRYPIDSLGEAFAEGISVGHRDMPEWRFEPVQIRQLLVYMNSVQSISPEKDKVK
jgi:mono/diheme cytochrome c family protein